MAALTLIPVLLSACSALVGSARDSTAGNGLERTSIKIAILPTIDAAPLWLAHDGGYFKAEGLDVQTVIAASGQAALAKTASGDVDIALSSYIPFFTAKSTGTIDVRLVCDATAVSAKSFAIVATPTSPVKTINDLAGKRIAMTAKNTATDLLAKSLMRDHAVDFTNVQWMQVQFPNVAAALAQNQVDAALLPEPYVSQAAKTAGAIPIIDVNTGATQDFPMSGYGTTSKWVQQNPKAMAAFQRAMRKATSDAIKDRSKIEPLLVKYAKIDDDTAKLLTLPGFRSELDALPIQRVPDLMLQMGAITSKIDAASMIAPHLAG
ncbi:ABC transporter substrate-binding protein [Amycolatopsis sp. cmx-4-68]|uniref:ABC transporter substrate-binding protein n=1 Tax=Amycolatopsis sp. cmx-4-68 TaxID=2790938 RepID=UPI00397A0C3C